MGEVELEGFFTNALESRGWLPGEFSKNDQTKDVMLDYTSQEKAILIHLVPINVEDLAQGYQVEIYYPD
jgi:hypothetical protein